LAYALSRRQYSSNLPQRAAGGVHQTAHTGKWGGSSWSEQSYLYRIIGKIYVLQQ